MDERTKHILKHPGYMGTVQQIMPGYIRKPLLREINFTKVPKTTVTCTHCWGMKGQVNLIQGHAVLEKCPICNNTGTMEIDNREVKGYGQ